jgi:hypothetical protein
MKSLTAHVGEKVTDHVVRDQRQVSPPFNWMHALHQVGDHYPADQVRRNEHTNSCTGSPPPVYLAFDAHSKDELGPSQLLEWSTVHHTTVRSTTQTRTQPFSIYGTSSDNIMAEELILEGVLLSPMSSLGGPNIPAPLNSTTMIWERIPASEGSYPKGTYLFHTASQEIYHDLGDEMDGVQNDQLSPTPELSPVLPMNTRSSFLSATGDVAESSATSKCIIPENPEMSPAKRRRVSAAYPRWCTNTQKIRKKKLEQSTIILPQSQSPTTPKINHNAIEQRYRNRLNDKFEALLSVLPARDDEGRGGSLAKISKGDVLILAKDYIERLEKSRDELQDDRSSLQGDVHDMKDAWLQSGGRDRR